MGISALLSLGLPLVMAIGAIAAWRMTRKEAKKEEEPAQWRDDSLDDWRSQRDAEAEAERIARSKDSAHRTGQAVEETETKKQQRIGG